jgi:hypothetical protein
MRQAKFNCREQALARIESFEEQRSEPIVDGLLQILLASEIRTGYLVS